VGYIPKPPASYTCFHFIPTFYQRTLYFNNANIRIIYVFFIAVCPPLPARHGRAGVESPLRVFGAVVFTPVLGIVLGDNKKNQTHPVAINRISIKYELFLKN
jgi:hypothetical protein